MLQAGFDKEVKKHLWEELERVVSGIPHTKKLFLGGDFNDHIGTTSRGYNDVNGNFDFGDTNGGGIPAL